MIISCWRDRKEPIPAARFPPLSYMILQVGRYAKFDKLFPGCQYVSDTVANVLLDWCSNPEAVSSFVTTGLKGKNTFDQFMVPIPFFILN